MTKKNGKYGYASSEKAAERERKQAVNDIAFQKLMDDFDTAVCKINNKCSDEGCDRKYIQEHLLKLFPAYCILAGINVSNDEGVEKVTDKQVIEAIHKIVERGNNAEVKRRSDGSLVVYEVKKKIAVGK